MVRAILSSLPSEIYRIMMFFYVWILGSNFAEMSFIQGLGMSTKLFSPCVFLFFFSPDERETRKNNWGEFLSKLEASLQRSFPVGGKLRYLFPKQFLKMMILWAFNSQRRDMYVTCFLRSPTQSIIPKAGRRIVGDWSPIIFSRGYICC